MESLWEYLWKWSIGIVIVWGTYKILGWLAGRSDPKP